MGVAERAMLEMKAVAGRVAAIRRMVGVGRIGRIGRIQPIGRCLSREMSAMFRRPGLAGVHRILFGKAMFVLGWLRDPCGIDCMRDGRSE